MKQEIQNLFKNREESPLFYVESGSRLWGIASPDSDYDVRGFHIFSKKQAYSFKTPRQVIEKMDGDFDFVSYDVDKMFGLLSKSNPTVLEWFRAHILYMNELPNWAEFRDGVISNYDFKALYHHYFSLARGHIKIMEGGKKFTYKAAFYCIRGLLSAWLAAEQIMPELLIEKLFDQFEKENEVIKIAKASLDKKKEKKEKESIPEKEQKIILKAVKDFSEVLWAREPESSNNRQALDKVLDDYAYVLKDSFYCC